LIFLVDSFLLKASEPLITLICPRVLKIAVVSTLEFWLSIQFKNDIGFHNFTNLGFLSIRITIILLETLFDSIISSIYLI